MKWVSSPHFNKIPDRKVSAIVIHTAECPELVASDDNVASWFANPASKVSAHYIVDADSVTQCVSEDHVAWHAGPVNDWTIGIELAGKASQTPEQWADQYSRAAIDNLAWLVTDVLTRHDIPIVRVTAEDIPSRAAGIFGHCDVTAAYKSKGGHYDPGPSFPWDLFFSLLRDLSP